MSPADEADKPKQDEEPKEGERAVATEPVEPAVEPTPESAPPLSVEDITRFEEHHDRRWLMMIVYFLMALAVAVLVVFGGRWAYRAITHKNNKPATTNQPAGNNVSQEPTTTPTTPTTPTPTPQPSTTAPSQTSQTSQLPDNGPGNIAAIFIGTAVVVGGLHFIYNLRKQN